MTSRSLTPGERALAHSIFGEALDLRGVMVHRRRWWPFQPANLIMAPNGCLWVPPEGDLWSDDYALADKGLAGLFVHELTHVWQHRQGRALALARHPFCRYRYRLEPGRPFNRYGIEQQAEIVRHAWLKGPGSAEAALLPFGPDQAVWKRP